MNVSVIPISKDGREGFRVCSGKRETEVFGNSRAATVDGVRALVAAAIIREHSGKSS